MRTPFFSRFTLQHLLLGVVCSIGAFAVGMETAGDVSPFGHTEAALELPGSGAVIQGDMNGNRSLEAEDASILLQFAEGLETPTPDDVRRGDTDGDGQLTGKDVLRVLHFLSNR